MTEQEKNQILKLKEDGLGYKKISKQLGISLGNVKSVIRRNERAPEIHYCKNCHKEISNIPGKKHKVFCCDACRMEWWNSHKSQVNKKANYTLKCIHCGKEFISYGNKDRKYCCHECYIAHRYSGGNQDGTN